jgi:AraC-like DNA-binding protein
MMADFNNCFLDLEYFYYRHATPNWCIESSVTDFIDFTYILGGSAVYSVDRQKFAAEEGTLLCLPPGVLRSATSNNPAKFECYAVNFHLIGPDGQAAPSAHLPLPILSSPGTHSDIISLYRRLNQEYSARRAGYVMRTRGLFMLILQRFMDILVYEVDSYNFDPRVKQAIETITTKYADNLTIGAAAAAFGLNPVYFGALFKRQTGVSYREYLNNVRCNQAEDLLRSGVFNVSDVAQMCGFNDVFYFSRLFKQVKGVPPSYFKS